MSTKNTEGRYSPNKVPSKPCLIKHLLNDGTCLEKNCHNHGLVGNRLGVYSPYSRLMLNKPKGKELEDKENESFTFKASFFQE